MTVYTLAGAMQALYTIGALTLCVLVGLAVALVVKAMEGPG